MACSIQSKGALFGRYLWVTNTATSGFFLAIGDGLQQKFEQIRALPGKKTSHDWRRTGNLNNNSINETIQNIFFSSKFQIRSMDIIPSTWSNPGRMMAVGFAIGLPQHWWYCWLDRVLPGISIQNVAKKVLLDQVICAPLACFSFFLGSSLLEQRSFQQSWEEFQAKFLMVYKVLPIINYLLDNEME